MSIQIVLLTGPAGCGKSTVADILNNNHGFRKMKFAAPLKSMLWQLRLNEADLEGEGKELPCAKLAGVTPRVAMQTLGTEWGRGLIHPDLWVQIAIQEVNEFNQHFLDGPYETFKVVFDDVRFENEIDLMREAFPDVTVINIVPGFDGYKPTRQGKHASERQELEMDVQITNKDLQTLTEDIAYLFPEPVARYYISGPMTGHEDLNFEAFQHAEYFLSREDVQVFNPANSKASQQGVEEMETGGIIFTDTMRQIISADIEAVMASTHLYMLVGWEDSVGARAEHALATWLGLTIEYQSAEEMV